MRVTNSAIAPPSPQIQRPSRLQQQLMLVLIHMVNLLSNLLGNDFLSCSLRRGLLQLLGVKLGPGTVVRGGGYIYGGSLATGAHCQINRGCYFDLTGSITLGDNVVVGHGVTFITAEHTIQDAARRAGPVHPRPIVLETGTWVGANATILPGITVGQGAIVGAGAVVTRDVPPNVVVAGVPAKVIKELEATDSSVTQYSTPCM